MRDHHNLATGAVPIKKRTVHEPDNIEPITDLETGVAVTTEDQTQVQKVLIEKPLSLIPR